MSSGTATTSDAQKALSSDGPTSQLMAPVSTDSEEGEQQINGPAVSLQAAAHEEDGCEQASHPAENGVGAHGDSKMDTSEVPPGAIADDNTDTKQTSMGTNENTIVNSPQLETPKASRWCPELAEALASFEHDDDDDEDEDLLINISEVESNELIDDDDVGDGDMDTNSKSGDSGEEQQQQEEDIAPATIQENKSEESHERKDQQQLEDTNNEDDTNSNSPVEPTKSSSPQLSPPSSSPVADGIVETEDTTEPAESISNNTAVNYPTALQKTLQLMAETDINTTEYTPTNSMDMRYRGPSASHPQRMPALSSLPAMFSESQPALFDLGQQGGGGNRSRVNSHMRSSPRGDGSDAGSGASGIIYEETDEEEGGGQASDSTASSAEQGHVQNTALEGRIDELERMVTRLTDLLMAQQQQQRQNGTAVNGDAAISPVAAQAAAMAATMSGTPGAITATPARTLEHEEATPPSVTETPAAPDLAHSNVLPLDSPSPLPRRVAAQTVNSKDTGDAEKSDGKSAAIPSPPRLDGTGKPPLATPAISGNADATPAQPTPDLEYRSYSQEHVDALRRRREAGTRRSYSFDVAEQLEREINQEAVKATPLATVRKSSRKPRLSPVPPSPIVPVIDKDTQVEEADNEETKKKNSGEVLKSTPTPTLAPRPHSGRLDGKAPPNKMEMPNLDLDDKSEKKLRKKSEDRSKDDKEERSKPPSRSNSSASLSSKVRSTSIASSKDGTGPAGASPPRPKSRRVAESSSHRHLPRRSRQRL